MITIGAHTRTHPQLSRLSAGRQREDRASSKATFENWPAPPIDLVAYPAGAHDDRTCALAAELGLRAGFTTWPRVVPHRFDPFRIPRIDIETQDARSFAALLCWYGVAR